MEVTKKNYNHNLVIVYAFLKYVWLYLTRSTGMEEVLNCLENRRTFQRRKGEKQYKVNNLVAMGRTQYGVGLKLKEKKNFFRCFHDSKGSQAWQV